MNKIAFDEQKYFNIQREEILKRISNFKGKLYLEFGGKLFDDNHASRVLHGFAPDTKLQMLLGLKEKVEIVLVVNAKDIQSNKVRNDTGLTYETEVMRLIDAYHEVGLYVSSVVLSFYETSHIQIENFITKLKKNNINVYKHYLIPGYPQNISLVVSKDGLGKNEYIKTSKELIVVTGPGPGSGKLATCLSQLYHDHKNGINAGYAKYETFPVWNLPLNHPVNLAYEAATLDLNDVNSIDPYHLENYGVAAVNYNRDIEAFPLLKAIFEKISGNCPYKSPTDMGVNMVGFAIVDDNVACHGARYEIVRRYYQARKNVYLGKFDESALIKAETLMTRLNLTSSNRKCVQACLNKSVDSGQPSMAIELHDGKLITGRRSDLLGASAAVLLNALKYLANIDDSMPLLSRNVIEPIQNLKVGPLRNRNARIRAEEILIALSIQASTNPLAELAYSKLKELRGCEAHSSVLLSETDLSTLNRLGLNVTEEPVSYGRRLYINKN